jgi:hypothetical protein
MTTATLHAHVYVESADCDGRYSRSYVMVSDAEDEWNVKRDIVGHILFGGHNGYVATFTDDGFTYGGPTDEGFEHTEIEWCTDDDADVKNTFRDFTAESMGY